MKVSIEKIIQSIYNAVEAVNEGLGPEEKIDQKTDSVVFGSKSELGSLTRVNLIVEIEQELENRLGIIVSLIEEGVFLGPESPVSTLGDIADLILTNSR
jgi:hypothetical protein